MATVSEALQLAAQHHRANRLAQAEQAYRKILETQPDHPDALHGLGVLAQQVGQYQAAQNWLSAALQVQPESVKAWFSLGNLRQAQGQLPEAVEAYRRALAIAPSSAAIYNNLGYALQQQGKWDEAIACYQKALEIQPNCAEADVNWGNALHAQGKLSPEQQAHYATANNTLGVSRKKAGDLKTAVAFYRQAIAMQPDLLDADYNLGVALQEQGEWEEAIACYQKVLELNPSYTEVYHNLAKIYQAQNNINEAISAYRQWLSLINPRYAKAVEAYPGSAAWQEEHTTPPISQGEVIVGGHRFPAIPPVSEQEGKRPFWSVVIPVYFQSLRGIHTERPPATVDIIPQQRSSDVFDENGNCYNRIYYLLECLASVLAQWSGEEEMEILVMDNASTPPLFELVNSLGRGVVRYYRHPQNLGVPGNCNAGIALSRGEWIHILHDDDYVLPGFYSRLKQSLEGCSESIGAAFTGYENINEKGEVVFSQQVYGEQRGIAQDWLWRIGVSNLLNAPAVVIRRATYERLGGYHPELAFTADWELYKRIAAFYDWWYEPGILARYRKHSNNMTTELLLSGAQVTSIRQAIEISESYLPADHCAEITAKARSRYFNYCLAQAAVPLKAGNLVGAFRLVQETLKIDRSSQAVAELFNWLCNDEAAPLRDEIASKLISLATAIADS